MRALWQRLRFSAGVSAEKVMAASDVLRRAEEGGYLDRLSDPLLCCLEDDASLIARAAPLVSSLLEPLRLRAGFRPRDPNLWIWKLKGSIGRRRS